MLLQTAEMNAAPRLSVVILLSLFAGWSGGDIAAAGTTKTFVVTSAVSAGPSIPGTLTWAIYQANYQGADVNFINFNIPPVSGEIEITLTETLYLARPMIIDATTEPGYAGQPVIRINCAGLNSGFNIVPASAGIPPLSTGAASTGGGSTIRGFRIINYASNAITLSRGADGSTVADNCLGFQPLLVPGTFLKNSTLFPGARGLGIQSSSNVIRGNTISGVDNAVTLGEDITAATGALCKGNSLQENRIGTDPSGSFAIGNASDGIFLGAGAQDNYIGPGNVLAGMASSGVELLHPTATGNVIFGNMIGVNAAGTDVIPNGELGVLIANGASNNWVGGPYGGSFPGNVIAGNPLGGVAIGTDEFPGVDGSNNNHVEGNLIGTDAGQTRALGTQISGITVQSKSKGNIIRKNVIVGQVNHGIVFSDATNNAAYGNWIGTTSTGLVIPNGGFGFYVLNASNNVIQLSAAAAATGSEQNFFGQNNLGPVGLNGTSTNNVIDSVFPPAPTPTPTPLPSATPTPGQHTTSQLLNISTRLRVETGSDVAIAGFIVTGSEPKKMIVRAIGPSLQANGAPIPGALQNPILELHDATGAVISTNDNWGDSADRQAIIDSTVAPTDSHESAIVALLNAGSYTAVVSGASGTTGVALVEVYDLNSAASSRLANISTRGRVEIGSDVMIGGFILGGDPGKVIVRAIGPSLQANGVQVPGALQDPALELRDANGTLLDANDNWGDSLNKQAIIDSTVPPGDNREAAVVGTLPAGNYTAVMRGVGDTQGVALVEVFSLN